MIRIAPCDCRRPSPSTGRVQVGNLRLSVRSVGDDFYLLVADTQNPAIQAFKGTTWFPIDASYRIPATFTAYAQPENVRISMSHVESKTLMTSTGDVTFQLAGRTVSLKSFVDDNELFIMFQDPTNANETYGGGRFLHAPLPTDGATVLDFNKAFSPYCSLNTFIMCPIPPPENRLEVRVAAGETDTAPERVFPRRLTIFGIIVHWYLGIRETAHAETAQVS